MGAESFSDPEGWAGVGGSSVVAIAVPTVRTLRWNPSECVGGNPWDQSGHFPAAGTCSRIWAPTDQPAHNVTDVDKQNEVEYM